MKNSYAYFLLASLLISGCVSAKTKLKHKMGEDAYNLISHSQKYKTPTNITYGSLRDLIAEFERQIKELEK